MHESFMGWRRGARALVPLWLLAGCASSPPLSEPVPPPETTVQPPGADRTAGPTPPKPAASRASAQDSDPGGAEPPPDPAPNLEDAPPGVQPGAADDWQSAVAHESGAARDSDTTGTLEQDYQEALEAFDRRLARERLDEPAPRRAGAPGADTAGSEHGQSGNRVADGVAGREDQVDGADRPGQGRGGAGLPTRFDPPDDIPPPGDDDIVARQLREAAETEPDPELRARLWEEYRAYKRSQG